MPRPTAMEHAGNPEMPGNRLIINHKTKVTNRETVRFIIVVLMVLWFCGFVVVVVAVLTSMMLVCHCYCCY